MSRKEYVLFDKDTKAFVYGYQTNAIQRMLDFDFICKRVTPSISAIINPSRAGIHKAFWGTKEIIPAHVQEHLNGGQGLSGRRCHGKLCQSSFRLRDHHGGTGGEDDSNRGRNSRGRA